MRISTVREFRDKASELLRSKDPILVTRRGQLAGIFFPSPQQSLPIELKREIFAELSAQLAMAFRAKGITEAEVIGGFARSRGKRRAARRRR